MIINRQVAKGICFLVAPFVAGVVLGWLAVPIVLVAWLIGLIDAILIAGRINRGESVREWQWF
jgi:hypothetical protein